MHKILLQGLDVDARIGVHEWEQNVTQRLLLDLELTGDFQRAALRDDLKATVDYARVASVIRGVAGQRHHALLETLAETLSQALFQHFPVAELTLTVWKPDALAGARAAGVRIQRRRESV